MIDSLEYSEESFDNAATAANALGDTPDPSAVEPLIKALQKPLRIKTRANIVKLEAMKSLAKIDDNARGRRRSSRCSRRRPTSRTSS